MYNSSGVERRIDHIRYSLNGNTNLTNAFSNIKFNDLVIYPNGNNITNATNLFYGSTMDKYYPLDLSNCTTATSVYCNATVDAGDFSHISYDMSNITDVSYFYYKNSQAPQIRDIRELPKFINVDNIVNYGFTYYGYPRYTGVLDMTFSNKRADYSSCFLNNNFTQITNQCEFKVNGYATKMFNTNYYSTPFNGYTNPIKLYVNPASGLISCEEMFAGGVCAHTVMPLVEFYESTATDTLITKQTIKDGKFIQGSVNITNMYSPGTQAITDGMNNTTTI